jgi:predicted aminopeptidase
LPVVTRIRALLSLLLFVTFLVLACHFRAVAYIARQAGGQARILINARPLKLTGPDSLRDKVRLVERILAYSTDSLGYAPSGSYRKLYEHGRSPLLWVITASDRDSIRSYKWTFPITGPVSYKGFFDRRLAEAEYNHLVCMGYDAEIRPVSAWSTLGWFNDPLLSGMLSRPKGDLCELLFHELFHGTYYEQGADEQNENLACFVAEKATRRFLAGDSIALQQYVRSCDDERIFNSYLSRKNESLKAFYREPGDKRLTRIRKFLDIRDSIALLPLHDKRRFMKRGEQMLRAKNAAFAGFRQYSGLQDSLEKVFNNIYRRDLKKMVQHLKRV